MMVAVSASSCSMPYILQPVDMSLDILTTSANLLGNLCGALLLIRTCRFHQLPQAAWIILAVKACIVSGGVQDLEKAVVENWPATVTDRFSAQLCDG